MEGSDAAFKLYAYYEIHTSFMFGFSDHRSIAIRSILKNGAAIRTSLVTTFSRKVMPFVVVIGLNIVSSEI